MKKVIFSVIALVFGLALVFTGSAFKTTDAASINIISSQWVYNPSLGSETDENSYVPGTLGSCTPGNNICGIIAEEDPNNLGHPMFSTGQVSRIETKDTGEGDVYLKN